MDKQLVPRENIEIYCALYSIETALRELIIELMHNIEGPRWYKKRLPGDILIKYRQAKEYESNIKWTQLVPQHPIYYIDFADLKKIIEREDNWKDVFKSIFQRKDILSSTLSELEFIRNKIAHNRKATDKDIDIVKGTYTKLSEAIGQNKFDELVSRCASAVNILEQLTKLAREAERTLHVCKKMEPLEQSEVWETIYAEWWFDELYLGGKLNEIANYFKVIKEYTVQPRQRGSGYKIEAWVKANNIEGKYKNAKEEFAVLLNNVR